MTSYIREGAINMNKRDVYAEKISAQIEQYNAKLVGMRARASEIQADMKLDYLNQVEKLEGKRDGLKEKIDQLGKASESSWESMKKGTEAAWNELKEAVDRLTSK